MRPARLSRFIDSDGEFGPPGKEWISLSMEYDLEFLDHMKSKIRSHERRWNGYEKEWLIAPKVSGVLEQCLRQYGYKQEWIGTEVSGTTQKDVDADTIQVIPTACQEVAKAAYRALCLMHHPDKGGSTEAMQKINDAWDRFRRRFEK